ncbi:hypothetical protein [Pseudomonas aeruginosa]|nr:hypothetical protein [Pseudomonas aeruginosa]
MVIVVLLGVMVAFAIPSFVNLIKATARPRRAMICKRVSIMRALWR